MKRKRKNLWNLVGVILLFLVLLPLRGEAAEPEGSSEGSEYECSWCGNTEAFITVKDRQETAGHRKVIVCEICSRIVFDSWYIPHRWKDGICEECEFVCVHPWGDRDKDHQCDVCKKELSQHVGGNATCTAEAICEYCGEAYGDKAPDNHTGKKEWFQTDWFHEKKWNCCGAVTVANEPHEWENGTCTECKYVCAHDDTDKDHQCDICRVELSQHTGGNATCTAEAICEYCGKAYGDKDPDNHTGKEEWIQTATTHEEKWSCCRAVIVAEEVHEWENGICKECGYTCSHTFGEWQTITAATCTEKGSKKHTCSICQLEETQEIPAAGHDWNGDFTIDKAATCEAPGSKSIHCKNCTEVKDVTELPATGHHFGTEPSEYTAPTENKSGQAVYVCSDCQEKRTVTIPALELQVSETAGNLKVLTPGAEGWSWESDQALLPGTVVMAVARYVVSEDLVLTQSIQIKVPCSVDQADYTLGNDGTAVLHCSGVLDAFRGVTVDGTLLTEGKDYTAVSGSTILTFTNAYLNTLKAGTHMVVLSYDSGEVTTTLEIREAEPVVCDHTYGKASYTWSSNYSTCTARHTCTKCGEEETASASVSEKITKEATCIESGEKTYTAVFENKGFEKQTKTETLKAIGHDWDEGKVTEEATTEKTGVKTYTCKNCQETRTEELPKVTKPVSTTEKEETPKTEAAPKADTVPKTTSVTAVPKTGDESMPARWLFLTLLSGGSLLLLGRRKRQ